MYKWKTAAVVAILALLIILFFGIQHFGRTSSDSPEGVHPRVLVLAVDGLSWDAFREAQTRGLFKRFRYSAPHISPYPSMSHPSWTEILGTRRMFGDRGNAHTIESRWFDLEEMQTADDPRQVIARQISPYNYQRAFDYFFNPLIEPLMYLRGEKVFNRELQEAEAAILSEFTGDHYVAYFAGPDAMGHTHLDGLWNYLTRLDSTINRVADSLDARGKPAEMWMVSDHGNASEFSEGGAEKYLTTFSLDKAIAKAGLVRADTGKLVRDDQVAVVTIALATMINVYFSDLEKRRQLADAALREPAVELVTWLEVRESDRYVVILGTGNREARLRWRNGLYSYEKVTGDPLGIPAALASVAGNWRWVSDSAMRAATADGHYPDAPFRIMQSAAKQVENAPDLIVNLRDGYCHKGDLGKFVRMVRTHGSLSARSSNGILATTGHSLPRNVRGEEVLAIMGLSPEKVLSRAALFARKDSSTSLKDIASNGWINTGRHDDSRQTSFLRRARPVAASMDYFNYDVMRAMLRDIRGMGSRSTTRSSVDATRRAVERADVVGGIANNVDTLLALLDSVDVKEIPARIRTAEQRARQIPGLASLGDIRSAWRNGISRPGGGATARQLTMAMWTFPYFLDDILSAPEEDSIRDPRDANFARRWKKKLRAGIASDPGRALRDSLLPVQLFDQVFAERKLIRKVQPAPLALTFDPRIEGITLVYVPGIYGELFDQEIWSRGVKSVRDRLGMRTLSIHVDGRCSSERNAAGIVAALREDTRKRIARGYGLPRYLMLGYSKGGIDATQALLLAPDIARKQVAALVTLATPHRGSPVAERSDIPTGVMQWGVTAPPVPACDTANASRSLWPSTRANFWASHGRDVADLTRFFSVSFVTDMDSAHPWMKLTKRIGEFSEPNDGVVALSSSRFPSMVHALNLGVVNGDHIAGRLASAFPQDAFLEAVVITVAELGALDPRAIEPWRTALKKELESERKDSRNVLASAFPTSLRSPAPLPGGSSGWTPDATFSITRPINSGGRTIHTLFPESTPGGIAFRCDQSDILAFRREYEFYYDSSNGGSENDPQNGFAIMASPGSPGDRACHLATRGTAIKITTVSFQFRPADFPSLEMKFKVVKDLRNVDAGKLRRGKNDAALKLWLLLEDTRPEAVGNRYMFGYWWTGRDALGRSPPPDSLVEALSSRRNLVFSTLPEAWLITMGSPDGVGKWQIMHRNLERDVRRAFPGIPPGAMKVVGITFQSDSDESGGETEVYIESMALKRAALR